MPRDQTQRYDWERTWLPSGYSPIEGTQGFFSTSLEQFNSSTSVKGTPANLRDLRSEDVLLLRGPSGSGKTVAMMQERDRLGQDGRRTEWLDLTRRPSLPFGAVRDAAFAHGDLTIFIDGVDFAILSRPDLLDELAALCDELDQANLGIATRMTIRSGVRCEALLSRLGRASEREIAPLSVNEARIAANCHGIDPDAFFRYIEALQAGPFATQPPTLRMLLALFKGGGEKPNRRDVLYREGCLKLAEEEEWARLNATGGDDPRFVGTLDAEARVAVARRIAASMVFGDKEAFDLGVDAVEGTVLRLADILGGTEPTRRGRTEVSRQGVREVVRTGLFRSNGGDRFAFAHPSLMDFLAADFVNERRFDLIVIQSLVRASEAGGPDRIAGNRVDVASWLAAMSPECFAAFSGLDPQVLLRSGIPARLPDERMSLAEALLQASAVESLDLAELRLGGDLVLVSNPGLASRLREVLQDRSLPAIQREFAIMLATDCGVDAVASDLLSVAGDPSEEFDLRTSSLIALRDLSLDGLSADVLRLALDRIEGDRDLELRGLALDLAYPSSANAGEIIGTLVPYRSGVFGNSYDKFCLKLARSVRDGELLQALRATIEVARTRHGRRTSVHNFVLIASGIAKRAFSRLDDSDVADALANLILSIPTTLDWVWWSDTFHLRGMPKEATDEQRRGLISSMVSKAPGTPTARILLEFPFLLRDGDLRWSCGEAASALDRGRRATMSTLAVEVARAMPGRELRSKLQRAGLKGPVLDDVTSVALPMPAGFDRWRPPDQPPEDVSPLIQSLERSLRSEPGSLLQTILDARLLNLRRAALGRKKAAPVAPGTLLALADARERRLVQDGRDLLAIVVESLGRLQARLTGQTSIVRALWNETKANASPKGEEFLSDLIVDHLRMDLADRNVFADREVEIRPRIGTTQGQRTDIRIQVARLDLPQSQRPHPIALTVEVKGCWNREVEEAMKTQLVDRYMTTTGDSTGLYVVGWYVCDRWRTPRVAGRTDRTADALKRLTNGLMRQAEEISDARRTVAFHVLDVALR